MTANDRQRVVFHGAAVLLVGLLCGYPTVAEGITQTLHSWREAHLSLMMIGIWLVSTAAVFPSLVLERREASGLVWSLLVTAYGFTGALLIEAITGVRGATPAGPVANYVAFIGNAVGVLGSILGAALTMLGARAALKRERAVGHSAAVPNKL